MKKATIELPDALFNQLKKAAEQKSLPFATYVSDLLAREISKASATPPSSRKEPVLPLIESKTPGARIITNSMVAEVEARAEAEAYDRTTRR